MVVQGREEYVEQPGEKNVLGNVDKDLALHQASLVLRKAHPQLRQREWALLLSGGRRGPMWTGVLVCRFNEITRQSVASCLRVPIKGLGVKGGVPTDIPGVDASSPFVAGG